MLTEPIFFQNSTKERMTHFNICVTVKHLKGNEYKVTSQLCANVTI